ncbi:MAG: DUF302 domain-containing protein [Pseudomonadota bacterium]
MTFPSRRLSASIVVAVCAAFAACETVAQPQAQETEETKTDAMTTISLNDFATTNARMKTAIESRGLNVFAVVDHAAGAEKAGLTLGPSTLYIFGNPQGGTPLMQANPALGLDLPLKALVYEEDGEVKILTTDIRTVASAAGVSEPAQIIEKVSGALAAISAEAAGL